MFIRNFASSTELLSVPIIKTLEHITIFVFLLITTPDIAVRGGSSIHLINIP